MRKKTKLRFLVVPLRVSAFFLTGGGSLPAGSTWTVAGVGRHQLSMAELAAGKGGNGRVGLEDNVFVSKGVLAKGNWELVAEAAKRARGQGREIATPQQAREMLRLG